MSTALADAAEPARRTQPLVDVRALGVSFDVSAPLVTRLASGETRKALRAVDDVSFVIAKGQTLSLVGESGCGKSTVARCIAGLMRPTSGSVSYRGRSIGEISKRGSPFRHEIQMVFQDPYGSLNPRWRVGAIIADPIRALHLALSRAETAERVAGLLEDVGLSARDAEKYPHQFSGGQRQRIAIARALAAKPAFVVCDEPTSALDVSVQAQILNLMRDLQDQLGLTYLFISHNLAVVDHMADAVGVMYLGRLVEIGAKAAIFGRPRHPYTQLLMRATPTLVEIGAVPKPMQGEVPNPVAPPAGCAFHTRCPFAIDRCQVERPLLRELGEDADRHLVACHRAEEVG